MASMFRHRQTDQKPDGGLINSFKEKFGDIVPPTSNPDAASTDRVDDERTRPNTTNNEMAFGELTPTAMQHLQFTPFVDPNALAYLRPGNQPNGYYTPNLGQLGSALQGQPGDLHPPNAGLNMMAPIPISNPVGAPMDTDPTAFDYNNINQHYFHQQYHAPNPFAQQASFAPSAFVNRDSGYDAIEDPIEHADLKDMDMQDNPHWQLDAPASTLDQAVFPNVEAANFRYNATLRAPTAMIRYREIPVTYLNKGQAYSLSIVDSNPPSMTTQPVKYRTCIRVSFEEEEQRSKPAACWQLWKEGRGLNESHQRGGKLQAVEYVDPIQGGSDDHKHRQIQLESSSFDGFCVTWTANPSTGASDCAIPVRFNFLSTDFSHSKGVKGIPVRLCAKTQIISPKHTTDETAGNAEVCYCKVKLFRDHGAERKLSNDVAHVKKTIDKLKQQISQAEVGGGGFGKRKRSLGHIALKDSDDRPSKFSKHKRRWSHDSQNNASGRVSLEDDLHTKLVMLQEMFTSTRSVSVLNLQGDEHDDPDNPVQLPGEPRKALRVETTGEFQPNLDAMSATSTLSPRSSIVSMSSSHNPMHVRMSYDSGYHGSLEGSREHSRPCSEDALEKLSRSPVKISRVNADPARQPGEYIEAVDVDTAYQPTPELLPKPVACFYVHFPQSDACQDDYYRAVYLTERTAQDLMGKISQKQQIDPNRIARLVRVNQSGMKIVIDDDLVQQLPDGQDMVADFSEAPTPDSPTAMGITLTF